MKTLILIYNLRDVKIEIALINGDDEYHHSERACATTLINGDSVPLRSRRAGRRAANLSVAANKEDTREND
jgi:hypothetical protein